VHGEPFLQEWISATFSAACIRVVNKDNTVSVAGRIIQIHPTRTRLSFVKAKVTVNHWLDGSWHVLHNQYGALPCEELVTSSSARAVADPRGDRFTLHKG